MGSQDAYIFVTADAALRRGTAVIREGRLGDALLSGIGMVKLIDLLLGVKVDHRGLARLMWGVHAMDLGGALRRYFTDLGMKRRGDVETLLLPEVVEQTVREAQEDVAYGKAEESYGDERSRSKLTDFLDRFEDRFYEQLDAVVSKRQREIAELATQTALVVAKPLDERRKRRQSHRSSLRRR